MSPEQYWEGDPYLARAYYEAHKLDIERQNQILWLQGWYIYRGVEVVASNILRKKGASTQKYLDKPLELFATKEEVEEEEVLKERKKAIEGLESLRKLWVQKHG